MTVREKFHKLLCDHGLWPAEADAVLDASDGGVREIMHKQAEGYPPQLFAVVWMNLKREAADWIRSNKPLHFALPMFDGTL